MKNKYQKYLGATQSTSFSKVGTFILDALFVIVVGLVFTFAVGYPIMFNVPSFQELRDTTNEQVELFLDHQVDAKLAIYDSKSGESEILPSNLFFNEYLKKQIALSYEMDDTKFKEASIELEDTMIVASYQNDNLAYYYTTYKVEHNINVESFEGLKPEQYFIDKVLKTSKIADFYNYNGLDLPYLKADTAVRLYSYLFASGQPTDEYTTLYNGFNNIINQSLNDFLNFEPFRLVYVNYLDNYAIICDCQNIVTISSYVLAFVLMILLPQLIWGNGITLGRLITKNRVVYTKEKLSKVIIRLILELIIFAPSMFISTIFTSGSTVLGNGTWLIQPILILGGAFIFLIVDIFVMVFGRSGRSVLEIASSTALVNIKEFKAKETTEEVVENIEPDVIENKE